MENPKNPNIQEKNVYEKLSFIRAELVKRQIKKSGSNTYSHFVYYELGDFLPHINELNNEVGLMTRFNIIPKSGDSLEKAVLEIINVNKPEEKVVFDSETANVQIGAKANGTGGADPIQNLGGKITYMRRYLMMIAYEIGDVDSVDSKIGKAPNANDLDLDPKEIKAIMDSKSFEELKNVCTKLKTVKGTHYHRSLMNHYSVKKEELEALEDMAKSLKEEGGSKK